MAAALTTVSLVVMVAIFFWLATGLLAFFSYFSGVFLPLAVAAILATLMKPYFNWLHEKLKSTGLALGVVVVSLVIPITAVFYFFGVMILGQVSDFFTELPVWIEKVQAFIEAKLPALRELVERYDLRDRVTTFMDGRGDLLVGSAAALGHGVVSTGSALFRSVAGMLGWLVLPIYFAYLIQAPTLKGKDVEAFLPFLRPETRKNVVYLCTEFVDILVAFFRGQLVIALSQGVMFAIGFAVVGLKHGVILGLILGLLNIVPYLGNIIGLAVVIPLAWFHPQGGPQVLIGVAIVFALVQVIESYVLTPRIMGKTTGLHPMAIIFAILFWGSAFNGLLGMILAIPLTAFLVVFWRLLKTRYIQEWL